MTHLVTAIRKEKKRLMTEIRKAKTSKEMLHIKNGGTIDFIVTMYRQEESE